MFIPGLSAGAMSTSGKPSSVAIAAYGSSTKTLIDNLQNLSGVPQGYFPLVSVCSNNDATAIRPQTVRVGDHYDVQRRRRTAVGCVGGLMAAS